MEKDVTIDGAPATGTGAEGDARYRTGTLQFTKASLAMLFIWLMWGDFCFTLLETVEPTIMPFMMDKLNASSTLISLFLVTIPAFMNFVLNPIISVKSDRYRSKWGRRIPFLAFSAPFIAVFLTLAGFSPEIGAWLHAHIFVSSGISKQVITLSLLGVVLVAYRFFNYFTATVFYYLFNDVVPEHFLGRFMTGFRAFAVIATFTYQWFIFKYAEDHARWIFLGVSILYMAGFALMCLKVKESEYPPPPENIGNKGGIVASINTFIKECFSHKFYQVWFMVYSFYTVLACAVPFLLLMQKSLGISLEQIGHMAAIGSVASFVVLFPAGFLSDKYHPFRVHLVSMVAMFVAAFIFAVLIIGFRFSHSVTYNIVYGYIVVSMPLASISATAIFPLAMRVLPKSRYGQFCAAGAMLSSLFIMLGGYIVGACLDYIKHLMNGNIGYLRYITVWHPLTFLLCLIASIVLFRMWKNLGGDASFTPPDPDQFLSRKLDAEI